MLKVFPMRNTYQLRFSKVLPWALINGAMFYAAWLWLERENQMARNIFVFYFWYCFVVTLILANLAFKKPTNPGVMTLRRDGPTVPRSVDRFYDLGLITLLVAYGHWIMGICWALQMYGLAVIFDLPNSQPDSTAEPETSAKEDHVRNPGDGQK